MDDHWDKIEGKLWPGSHVTAYFTNGLVLHGYVFVPDGFPDGPDPSNVMVDGWVHFPKVEVGRGSNVPIRLKLDQWLPNPGVERLKVVNAHLGTDREWDPACPECEAVGPGEITPHHENGWECLVCNATFDAPERICTTLSQAHDIRQKFERLRQLRSVSEVLEVYCYCGECVHTLAVGDDGTVTEPDVVDCAGCGLTVTPQMYTADTVGPDEIVFMLSDSEGVEDSCTITLTPNQQEINALATELEIWARTADAGEVLDWVCAQWMGVPAAEMDGYYDSGLYHYSTDPAAAMRLLLVMANSGHIERIDFPNGTMKASFEGDWLADWSPNNFELLDIARACAVLTARGIGRQGRRWVALPTDDPNRLGQATPLPHLWK